MMKIITQKYKGIDRKITTPLVYKLLENKTGDTYVKVLYVLSSCKTDTGIRTPYTLTVMPDFKHVIINAVRT